MFPRFSTPSTSLNMNECGLFFVDPCNFPKIKPLQRISPVWLSTQRRQPSIPIQIKPPCLNSLQRVTPLLSGWSQRLVPAVVVLQPQPPLHRRRLPPRSPHRRPPRPPCPPPSCPPAPRRASRPSSPVCRPRGIEIVSWTQAHARLDGAALARRMCMSATCDVF